MISLREYQQDGVNDVYGQFRGGTKRVIFWLQTGGGKTRSFCRMVEESLAVGLPVVIVMRRRELIKQTSATLDGFNIPHGVYMAGHRRFRPNELVQVCSIDTLAARGLYPHEGKMKLNIVDESHDCTPTGRKYVKYFDRNRNDYFAGFTATPFSNNSLFESIVCPIEAWQLRDQGFLVPDKTYVPNIIDVSNVSKTRGDYNEKELFEAAASSAIIGDFVRDWKLYSQWRPTVLFAVNIKHSKLICDAFNEAGVRAEHCDAKTSSSERDRALDRLVKGEIQVLTNVNIFSTGVDVPEVACIQICRPTQSVIWHLQSIGRGLRIAPHVGKENCIVIDNAGNTLRHGTAYRQRTAIIGKPPRRSDADEDDISIRRCKKCTYIFDSKIRECPNCGHVNPIAIREVKYKEGELIEHQMTEEEILLMKKKTLISDYHKLTFVERKRNMSENWKYYKLKEKYERAVLLKYYKEVDFPLWIINS